MSAEEIREWTKVEELKGTLLGALVVDLKEIDDAIDDLDGRRERIREMISAEMQRVAGPVRAVDRRLEWVAETETKKLSKTLLVQAGVTPEQLLAGTETGKKKAHLRVDTIKTTTSLEPMMVLEPSPIQTTLLSAPAFVSAPVGG